MYIFGIAKFLDDILFFDIAPQNVVSFKSLGNMTLLEWQQTFIPPKEWIVQTISTDNLDRWSPYPVGYNHRMIAFKDDTKLLYKLQIGNHSKLLLISFRKNTDNNRPNYDGRNIDRNVNRKTVFNNLQMNGFKNLWYNDKYYYEHLSNYKFVISPEGRGIDCHRHYEALMAGCIIIAEEIHHSILSDKYGNVPILYTNNYTEINKEYLSKQYLIMINKTYNYDKLLFSFWFDRYGTEMVKRSARSIFLLTPYKSWYHSNLSLIE